MPALKLLAAHVIPLLVPDRRGRAGRPEPAGPDCVRGRLARLRRRDERLARGTYRANAPHRPARLGGVSAVPRPAAAAPTLLPETEAQAAVGAEHVPVEEEHRGPARQPSPPVAAQEHFAFAPTAHPLGGDLCCARPADS